MQRGRELEHFNFFLNSIDSRGSGVFLRDGIILEGGRQVIPSPAMAWEWRCVQTYPCRASQHINVLELVAFSGYLRFITRQAEYHSLRILHVLDICTGYEWPVRHCLERKSPVSLPGSYQDVKRHNMFQLKCKARAYYML